MKDFKIANRMLTIRGEFYPTGFLFVMVPSLEAANTLESALRSSHLDDGDTMLLTSETILEQIVPTAGRHGDNFPSVGTESAMVHKYRRLALEGHCALMIKGGSAEHTRQVMDKVRTVPFSIAEKYRFLVIEDMD